MRIFASLSILLAAVLLNGCAHTAGKASGRGKPDEHSTQGRLLTHAEALSRSIQVSNVSYDMLFDLNATDNDFHGKVMIRFDLADQLLPLRVDFQDGKITSISVNDQDLQKYSYNSFYLEFAPGTFKHGTNTLIVDYTHPYGKNGVGLHRFKDPEDGQVYMYSNFEPFDAHRLFPCFDQPDIKAHYTLTVSAPAAWSVVTSVHETRVDKVQENKTWFFPQSPLISTYLISLHAGPYQIWTSKAGDIPLRLFARKSLGKYIVPKNWFDPTIAGLKFYGNYFGVKYPFKKYDQIIAPDFNAGAMENVAAVTFSERYIQRGTPTVEDKEALGSVILHEMAHMWFGDLVTMKWWNGLWLNESFATFMSALSLHEATPYKRSWESFFLDEKLWAYFEDQMHTTHPIEADVPDTEQAFANFDGITYGKGASALKQLSFFLGPDKFRDGVREYFQKFAYKNATLHDFLDSLQTQTDESLAMWSKEWLETPGLNSLRAEGFCENGEIKNLTLVQDALPDSNIAGEPILRHHRTTAGYYNFVGRGLKVTNKDSVKYSGVKTSDFKITGRCPKIVYPNVDDQDYAKVKLKKPDVVILKDHLKDVTGTFDRLLFWSGLWDMVRDQGLTVDDYFDLALKNLSEEKDLKVLGFSSGTIYGGRRRRPSALMYLHKDPRFAAFEKKAEDLFWKKLQAAPGGSDLQKRLFDSYASIAQSGEGLDHLRKILSGELKLKEFKVDQDRRWDIIQQLNSFGTANAIELLGEERERDTSNQGVLAAIASEASQPSLESKRKWLNTILTSEIMPYGQKRAAMRNLFPWYQEDLRAQMADDFYNNLLGVVKTQEEDFQENYAISLVPTTCSLESSGRLKDFIALKGDGLPPAVVKALSNALQEDERCVRVRNFLNVKQTDKGPGDVNTNEKTSEKSQ